MNTVGTENNTFKYWGEYWLEKKKNKVCYSQYRNLQCYLHHLYDFIGDIPIRDIKPDNIDTLLDALTEKNPNTQKPASWQYLIDLRNAASGVFESAIDNDILVKNPARKREVSKYAPRQYRRALSQVEQRRIIVTPHRARIGSLIMMLAGLRRGELIPLLWDDIDLNDLVIHVNKSVEEKQTNHFVVKNGTKT